MAKENQAAEAKADKGRRPQVEPTVVAELTDDLVGLAQLAGGPVAAAGDGTILGQAGRLGDTRLQSAQRQALAAQIGRLQGNGHLQGVLASLKRAEEPASYQLNNDGGQEIPARQAIPRVEEIPAEASPDMVQPHHDQRPATRSAPDTAPLIPVARLPENRVQRLPVRAAIGTPLGTIRFRAPGYVPGEGQLRVETEIVPSGERPGRFTGYRHRLQALAQAWRQDTLCGIGEDREGRFHVLRTDWPLHSPQAETRVQIIPYENPLFVHLWWVEMPTEQGRGARTGPGSWAQRVSRARDWSSAWRRRTIPQDFPAGCRHEPRHGRTLSDLRRCLEAEFVDLLAEALGIGRDMIHVARSRQDRNPNAVNFDLELTEAVGRGGIGRLPTTRTGSVPRPTVAIGPRAFVSESRLRTLSTALHEVGHFSHGARSIELLERWRRSGSRMTFEDWLRRERQARRISQVEYDLTVERIRGGEDATETLARLEAFTSVYHRLPITRTAYRFTQIDGMAEHWARAGHQINRDSIRRLADYYRGLDAAHRADFAAHARRAEGSLRGRDAWFFWSRVVRDVLSQ